MTNTIEEIYNNYMKAWDCLLNDNAKIVKKYGYCDKDAKNLLQLLLQKY